MKEIFTLESALKYSQENRIEQWVHEFLLNEGDNEAFSEGLKKQERYWHGPIRFPLTQLRRCCGPEDAMEFYVEENGFKKNVERLMAIIEEGWDMPPLIVEYVNGELVLNDGNHRLEALQQLGFPDTWVIFWNSDNQECLNDFIESCL